jgi:hypothetical protein
MNRYVNSEGQSGPKFLSTLPLSSKIDLGEKFKEGEMGEACRRHGGDEKFLQKFWSGKT